MKWKEFKETVEKADVKDDDEIWYIDIGNFPSTITVQRKHLGITIENP